MVNLDNKEQIKTPWGDLLLKSLIHGLEMLMEKKRNVKGQLQGCQEFTTEENRETNQPQNLPWINTQNRRV